MKLFVATIRYGDLDWMRLCTPTQDAWCERHGLKLHIYGNDYPDYPCVKFCTKDMLEDFLKSDYTHMMYIDADVFIMPQAPLPEFGEGFYATNDMPHSQWLPRWRMWCKEKFGRVPNMKHLYRNAGVWACDRTAAEQYLAKFQPPFIYGIQEQHFGNWAMSEAVDAGMILHQLDGKWNRHPGDLRPAHFIHIFGTEKFKQYTKFEQANLVPHRPEEFIQLPKPTAKRAIVYPWNGREAKWHELRFSLRSVEKHFEDKDCDIYILGTERPGWLLEDSGRVKFQFSWSYADALSRGVQLAEEVLWMNDDILLLRQVGWDDFAEPLHLGPVTKGFQQQVIDQKNAWQVGVIRALANMEMWGVENIHNYSTHTPYLYEREKALEIFRRYGVWGKMPLEILYYSIHGPVGKRMEKERTQNENLDGAKFLNFTDAKLTPALKTSIAHYFPDFAPWELKKPFNL